MSTDLVLLGDVLVELVERQAKIAGCLAMERHLKAEAKKMGPGEFRDKLLRKARSVERRRFKYELQNRSRN